MSSAPAFPAVPAAVVDRTATTAELDGLLGEVEAWRGRVRAWLRGSAASEGVSAALRDLLRLTLESGGDPAPVPGAYDVRAFPPGGLDPGTRAWAVLVWRSALVDYLSDAWDTLGPGALGVEECALVVDDVLTPAGSRPGGLCLDCLQPVAGRSGDAAAHTLVCAVRAARTRTATERPSPW